MPWTDPQLMSAFWRGTTVLEDSSFRHFSFFNTWQNPLNRNCSILGCESHTSVGMAMGKMPRTVVCGPECIVGRLGQHAGYGSWIRAHEVLRHSAWRHLRTYATSCVMFYRPPTTAPSHFVLTVTQIDGISSFHSNPPMNSRSREVEWMSEWVSAGHRVLFWI